MIWECHSPSTLSFPFTFLSSEACTLSCTSSLSLSVFAWRLASFPTPHPGTGCLLPLLNMGQIRETFACLFLKREVLNREHSHSIVPFQGMVGGGTMTMQEQPILQSWLLPGMWLLETQRGLLGAPSPSKWTVCAPTLEDTGWCPYALCFRVLIWLGFEVIIQEVSLPFLLVKEDHELFWLQTILKNTAGLAKH